MNEDTAAQWAERAREEEERITAQWQYEEEHAMTDHLTQLDKAELIANAMNDVTQDIGDMLTLLINYADEYNDLPARLLERTEGLIDALKDVVAALEGSADLIREDLDAEEDTP